MNQVQQNRNYSIQEYFSFEKYVLDKHEYFDGKICKRKSVTHIASEISAQVNFLLWRVSKSSSLNLKLYTSDMKIAIPEWKAFVYPDAVVVCEKPEFYEGRKDIIINPLLIVEVASVSTEEYDRSTRFDKYRTLPSFKEYLLIRQDASFVSQYFKEEKDLWRTTTHKGLENKITLQSLGCEIYMADIYEDISFDED